MNICRLFETKCHGSSKSYGAALLTALLLALPSDRLMATGIFSQATLGNFVNSYHPAAGYLINDGDYETGSNVDVSSLTYPYIVVGYSKTGNVLTINSGYTVTDSAGYVGYNSGSGGTVIVTGSGSKWANTGKLYIGYLGTGELDVDSNGTVTSTVIYIGGTGTVNTTGTGVGALTISSGTVSSTNCYVGCENGTSGAVTVNGNSSSFSATNQLVIGAVCAGSLTVEGGGTVTSGSAILGNNTGVTGTALVTGAGSTWTNTDGIEVGYSGKGTLNIEDGGAVTGPGCDIGWSSGSSGTVTVTGENSKLTMPSNNATGVICVGYDGTGVLNIENKGSASAYNGYVGGYSGSSTTGSGTVTVTGSGSALTCSNLYVGYNGKGALNVKSGGSATIGTCYIGENSGSSGKVTVTGSANGTASTLTAGGGLVIGNNGSGELNILDGGHVHSGYTTFIGYNSTGTTLVSGSGSEFVVTDSLKIGQDTDDSAGKLTIENGGLVTATGFSIFSGKGTLYINGGYLAISGTSLVSTIDSYITKGDVYLVDASGSYEKVTDIGSSLLSLDYYTYNAGDVDIVSLYTSLDLDTSLSYTILTSTYSVPEPSTWALIGGIGALGMALCARRRRV
jgi:T5SS/PEP-CTERM-associated repeat protein